MRFHLEYTATLHKTLTANKALPIVTCLGNGIGAPSHFKHYREVYGGIPYPELAA